MDVNRKMFENLKYAMSYFAALGEQEGHPNGRQRFWASRDYSNGYRIECVVIEETYAYNNRYYNYYDGCSPSFRISEGELLKFLEALFPNAKQESTEARP